MAGVPDSRDPRELSHLRSLLRERGIDTERLRALTPAELRALGMTSRHRRDLLLDVPSGQTPASALQLGAPAPVERRQQLTVMFCDMQNFSGLVPGHDPEALRSLVEPFVDVCWDRVERCGGHVAQVLGDGILAYFGWPTAHEDDAERCVRAALAIVSDIRTMDASGTPPVRIGIATGQVVVGGKRGIGPGHVGLAVGEAPILAERLQKLADPYQILVNAATRTLLGPSFELHELTPVTIRELGTRRVWRVDAIRPHDHRSVTHHESPQSALVGREQQVGQLLQDWQDARDGRGRVVLIGGEAGIGKSRLTGALREAIVEPYAELRFQCSSFHQSVALYPVISYLEAAAGFTRDETPDTRLEKLERLLGADPTAPSDAVHLLAALLSLPAPHHDAGALSPQKQRERTLEVLCHQIEALSYRQRVLMVIEDAHWIDPTSQELTDAMVRRLPALRVLLVVTYRPEQPYSPRDIAPDRVTTMTVPGLQREHVAALAYNVAGGKRLPDNVVSWIDARTDGLPLYVEELTRSLLESGKLLEDRDEYRLLEPLPNIEVPATLQGLLFQKMDRQDGMSVLAQIGSCLGRTFSWSLLEAVAGPRVDRFDDGLDALVRTGLVARVGAPPNATYTFRHALVRDAAYNSITLQQQAALHKAIADVIQQQFPAIEQHEPHIVAEHRTRAGTPEDLRAAVPLWKRAGEAALARVALQEAVNYLERGLTIIDQLEPGPQRDHLELMLRRPLHTARLRWRGWASAEVGANATTILWLAAQRQDDPESLLIGLWGLWINTITQGRVAETTAWARRLLDSGRTRGSLDLEIFGERALLSSYFYLGRLEDARGQRDRILALYDPRHAARWMELTGNDTRTAVGIFVSQVLWMLGYPDQAAHLCIEKDVHAEARGPFDLGWALTWGAYVWDYRHETDRLLACAAKAGRIGHEQGLPIFSRVLAPTIEGFALRRLGRFQEAKAALQAGIAGWSGAGGHLNLPYVRAALAETLVLDGDIEGGLGVLDGCLDQIDRPGWHERVWFPEVLRLKGWALLQQGRRAEAEAQLRASITWAGRQGARSWELRSATTLAQLLAEDDRRAAARDLLAPILGWFSEGLDTHDVVQARALLDTLS
jgi:class 3 adenylate cyclase/tetratricopeptide (TPR) repeat protein